MELIITRGGPWMGYPVIRPAQDGPILAVDDSWGSLFLRCGYRRASDPAAEDIIAYLMGLPRIQYTEGNQPVIPTDVAEAAARLIVEEMSRPAPPVPQLGWGEAVGANDGWPDKTPAY